MSQVIRKFANSGKIQQNIPELFERQGVGKYNKADLISGLYRNIDTYIKNNNLSGDRANSFRNSANQFIKGIENGTITMNGDGTFSDSTGQMSSTGKFDKNWIGRKKDTTNNAFNLVGDYALDYINQMSQYSEPAPTPKSKFNTNEFLTKEISKRWYGGNNIDFDNWFKNRTESERNTLLGEIFNNANYNKLYQDYDWTNTGIESVEDLTNRFKNFGTAITNNVLDNEDYNKFAELGGTGLDKFMKETKEVPEPTIEETKLKAWENEARAAGVTTPEAISAYVQGKQREEADKNAAIIKANEQDMYNREREKYFEDFISQNPFKGTVNGYVAKNVSYNPENVLQHVDTKYKGVINDYLKVALDPRYFKGQLIHKNAQGQENLREHLANNLDLAINTGKLPKIDDTTYAIPGTYNYDNWSLVTYNPSTRQYKETSMLANDALKKIAYAEYDRRKKTPTNKEGGILKFQYGGFVEDDSVYNAYREQFVRNKEEKKQQTAAQAKATNRTPEQVEAGSRKPMAKGQDWEYEDYARLVSAGADVGSMIASFVPGYGTVASAGLGLGSTIGNFTADLADDSVSLGSAFGNAALGLGMDAVGLIPGLGAAGKGSKIIKNLLKVAPKLMTIWSTSTSFAPAMQAFNKLRDKGASEMTVDDWRALSNGLTAAAGATRWGASAARNKILTNKYGTPTRTITTKSGKQVQMSEDEFRRIKGASGIEGQNQALKDVKGAENEELPTTFKKWYNPKRIWQGTPETSKNTVINTDAMKRVAPDGTVLVPTKYSNEGIWKEAVNNNWGGNQKGWQGPSWLKNWGYTPKSQKNNSKNTRNVDNSNVDIKTADETINAVSSIVQSLNTASKFKSTLALPAPGQATPSNRVFIMGSSKSSIKDRTNPSKLQKPGSYIDRAVPVGGTPVESPDAGTIRTVNAISSILQPFTNRPKNLPAVVPASRNAEKVVASRTIQPTKRLDQFIEDQIPGGLVYGRARTKRENEYRDIFHPAAEAEYNRVWDEAIKNKKDFGYEEVTPRRNPYTPPTPTEIYITPQQPIVDKNARFLWELVNKKKLNTSHNKREELPHKKSGKKKKTSRDNKIRRRADGGLIIRMQKGSIIPASNIKKSYNFNVVPEDILSLGRMVGGLSTNNKAAKLYKEGLKPTLISTFENTVPVQGNFQAKTIAEQQANSIESMVSKPRTSDSSLQLAAQLEANNKAAQMRFQGALQDSEMFYKTRMLGQQESDAAKARRIEAANKNISAINQINAAKKQIDATKATANYSQVIAPFLAGIENKLLQKKAMKQQLDMESAQKEAERLYSPEFDKLAEEYNTAYKNYGANNNNNYTGWETSNEYKSLISKRKSLNNDISQFLLNKKRSIIDSPYMFQFEQNPIQQKIPYSKSGSKLTAADRKEIQRTKDFNKRLLEDAKQFHKNIMESKKEHNKMIISMSSLTAELIKKAMS